MKRSAAKRQLDVTADSEADAPRGAHRPTEFRLAYRFEAPPSRRSGWGIACRTFDEQAIEQNAVRACDPVAAGDSCGGIVECRIRGVIAGLREPAFDKLDAELAKAMLSIGTVKGIEFGSGFAAASMLGSEHNDQMSAAVGFLTNHWEESSVG